MQVTFDGNLDDVRETIDKIVKKLAQTENRTAHKWKLQLRDAEYLGPYAAALFASTVVHHKVRGAKPRVVLPDKPPPLKAFCAFSGMQHLFRGGDAPDPNHEDCETVPLTSYEGSVNVSHANPVISLLERHGVHDEELDFSLRICISEAIQNTIDHAQSPIGAWLCARFMTKAREIRIAIVDRGLGIYATLSKAHPDISTTDEALRRVRKGNISAKSRENNMGLGISNLCNAISERGGRLTIASGTHRLSIVSGQNDVIIDRLPSPMIGTGVFFKVPCDGN